MSRDDWSEAALLALADGGLQAVAVEPLASALGATKGSFYWHFADRDALIAAVLDLWERRETDQVVAELDRIPDPEERLRRLVAVEIGERRIDARVDAALHADAEHPLIAPVLARVTEHRLCFLERLYRDLGFEPAEAARRALLTYNAYVGRVIMSRAAPHRVPEGNERDEYLHFLMRALAGVDA